mgnify:FL=1
MAGYIGARSVSLSATVANAQDVTATDTTPEVTIINNTHEDTDGGREGKVIFKGQQSGGEESTLAEIQGSHDGTADDEKGDLIFRTNDGSDGASPTTAMIIDSAQKVGIGTTSPDGALHVKGTSDHGRIVLESGGTSGSTNNMFMQFHNDGGTEIAQIEIAEGASNEGQMVFKTGGTTSAMTIDKDGIVTKPLQPAFQAHPASQINNIGVGTNIEPSFDNERFDQNGDYDGTNTFTAPVTGKYQFNCLMYVLGIDTASDYYELMIATSNKTYYVPVDPGGFVGDLTYYNLTASVLADMDANDTCLIRFRH